MNIVGFDAVEIFYLTGVHEMVGKEYDCERVPQSPYVVDARCGLIQLTFSNIYYMPDCVHVNVYMCMYIHMAYMYTNI